MRKLPCASNSQDDELDERPADDARVGGFGLVAEFGFAFLEGEGGVSLWLEVEGLELGAWNWGLGLGFRIGGLKRLGGMRRGGLGVCVKRKGGIVDK